MGEKRDVRKEDGRGFMRLQTEGVAWAEEAADVA